MNKTIIGLAVAAALGGSLNAQAFINFDVNGTAAGGAIQTDVFDWAPGNTLFQNLVTTPLGTTSFDLYGHGSLTAFLLNGSTNATAQSGTEFTYTFHIPMVAVNGSGITTWDLNAGAGGIFEIYFGSTNNNNTDTGAGFADGKLILQGSFLPQLAVPGQNGSIKTIVEATGLPGDPKDPLDSFGANGKPGITSDTVNGNIKFRIDATYADSNFFITDVVHSLINFDVDFSSQLTAPFTQVNPSAIVGGVAGEVATINAGSLWGSAVAPNAPYNKTPNFGGDNVNDASCTTFPCDIQAQSDASSTFRATAAPEPATLALIGAGLLGLGASRRRNRKV